jgi:hypothetical protein
MRTLERVLKRNQMDSLLEQQLQEALAEPARGTPLGCASALRVSAGTLLHAHGDAISATTAVGVLGRDDVDAFQVLVAEVCDEYGLNARVSIHGGTYSVRFTPRATEPTLSGNRPGGFKSVFAWLISR